MSTLQQLQAKGLDVELEMSFSEFFLKEDDTAKDKLRALIDQHGLKSNEVMREVGSLQRAETLKPGIYKEFVSLNDKLGNGAQAQPAAAQAATAPQTAEAAPAASNGSQATTEAAEDYQFSDVDEAKVRELMEKEEAKIRERLAAREKTIRERMVKRQSLKAQRLGLKAEDAAKIHSLKTKIDSNNAQVKVLREENNKLREEIYAIRPKRAGGPRSTKKIDPEQLKQWRDAAIAFLKSNPQSMRKRIVEGCSFEPTQYSIVISDLLKSNSIVKHGAGPKTSYSVA